WLDRPYEYRAQREKIPLTAEDGFTITTVMPITIAFKELFQHAHIAIGEPEIEERVVEAKSFRIDGVKIPVEKSDESPNILVFQDSSEQSANKTIIAIRKAVEFEGYEVTQTEIWNCNRNKCYIEGTETL
ncbi:MAG: hypothetical protein Q8M94_05240, partial [Ignavibacteria bacterium]|nr:hypothetical protein [Ignavibacteria bacterium]